MQESIEQRRRHWADVAVIFVGLVLLGLAIWSPPFSPSPEVRNVISTWQIYAVAGGLSVAALLVGQRWRWRMLARLMLFAAAVVLVTGVFSAFRYLGPAAWLTAIVPAILLLAATPFFGPMPPHPDR
jgi:peptidoglycan/LPS O-acetylase OafA/YrhL